MKVWIVDTGAYQNNFIDKIFLTEDAARQYAKSMNDEAAAKAIVQGYRSMDDSWDVRDYDVEP